jgi:hypothetical protein
MEKYRILSKYKFEAHVHFFENIKIKFLFLFYITSNITIQEI